MKLKMTGVFICMLLGCLGCGRHANDDRTLASNMFRKKLQDIAERELKRQRPEWVKYTIGRKVDFAEEDGRYRLVYVSPVKDSPSVYPVVFIDRVALTVVKCELDQ